MNDLEGVIKYQLDHKPVAITANININPLNSWRSILYKLQLIGQDPARYQGLGYGNLSQRLEPVNPAFLITGTQTGHLPNLSAADYVMITQANPERNFIASQGLIPPSSEALTHASIYQHTAAQVVIHVHSPDIWRNSQRLNLACIGADIAYGTPAMAAAVEALCRNHGWTEQGLFSMLGHEDGIVAFANSLSVAAQSLIEQLAMAISLEQQC